MNLYSVEYSIDKHTTITYDVYAETIDEARSKANSMRDLEVPGAVYTNATLVESDSMKAIDQIFDSLPF